MPHDDATRLYGLMDGLVTTDPKRRVSSVTPGDAAAVARIMHAEMDEVTDKRSAAIAAAGRVLACKLGCNNCCAELVMVYRHEALAVAEYLDRAENSVLRQRFLDRYHDWRAAVGDVPEKLAALDMAGRPESYTRAHARVWKDAIMCAFDDDGSCTVYEARPNVCRGSHALDTHENCSAATGLSPEYFDFVPLNRLASQQRPVNHALQRGLGLRHGMAPLCDDVYRALVPNAPDHAKSPAAKIGRNEPCPCGSGKKYKRCCGV